MTKDVQDLYFENYETVLRVLKKDLNDWRHILCPWIRRLNIVKMSVVPKFFYRFNATSIKILAGTL